VNQSQTRLARAAAHYRQCNLCEHRCGVDRAGGERGPCKAGTAPRLFRHRIEYGEELDLIPSHEFYLSGCDLRCAFCIAGINAFDPSRGEELTPDLFNRAVAWGCEQGARNIQWVGGEPTIHLPAILQLMQQCPHLPPVVWKSDFHCTPDALELLDGVAEIYVADFKFGNDRCAQKLAGVQRYLEIVTRNLKLAVRQGRLIVRHLLMPGHIECCFKPAARWMARQMPDTEFSLREGYLPSWRAADLVQLNRPIRRWEIEAAQAFCQKLGLRMIQ